MQDSQHVEAEADFGISEADLREDNKSELHIPQYKARVRLLFSL